MQQPINSLPCHSPQPYPSHLRIADHLLLDCGDCDDNELLGTMNGFRRHHQAEVTCGFECSSPRKAVSRLFRKLKERRRPAIWRDGADKELVDVRSARFSTPELDAIDGNGERGSSAKSGGDSGSCGNGDTFNMGVACSLLYLLASSKDELTKMKELRTNMEMLIQNFKEDIQRRDSVTDTSVLKESPTVSCLTDLKEVPSFSSLRSCRLASAPYLFKREEESITLSSRSILCDVSRKESVRGMDQLEAELEAELEQLQLQLDTESFSQSQKITGYDSTAKTSGDTSLGEVIDLNEAPTEIHGGVPPIELERKLHELLQSRQQERIKELESALEYVKQKLSEKEKEAKWWKDTALLMSRHVPEPPDRS